MQALVSIVMPTYNCGSLIAESIESVLAQTYPHWELLIVDDASRDNTEEVVQPFLADPRVRYERLAQNSGADVARSRAMALATGDYVAFLDSDDLWLPEKLEQHLTFMQNLSEQGTPCYFSCTAYTHIDDDGNSLHRQATPPKKTGYWKMLRLSCPIGNSTVMYDRRHYGGDLSVPPIKKRNDFALWLSMLRGGEICYGMTSPLSRYRVRTSSLSSNKLSLVKYHWQLYRKIEKLPAVISAFFILCWAFVKGTGIGLNRKKTDD